MAKYDIPADTVFSLSCDATKCDEDLVIARDKIFGVLGELQLEHPWESYVEEKELYEALWNQLVQDKKLITHIFVFKLSPLCAKRPFTIHFRFSLIQQKA